METAQNAGSDERYHRNNTEVANAFYMTKRIFCQSIRLQERELLQMAYQSYIEVRRSSVDFGQMQNWKKNFCSGDILGKHPGDASICFRKLGRHHMLPAFIPRPTSAYAFDVRSGSHVHEFLHMYDHFHVAE